MTSNKSKKSLLLLTNKKRKTSPLQDVSQNVLSKKQKTATTNTIPSPQGRIAKPHVPIQCWAHSKATATRCRHMVSSREGEPIPIPYCDAHLKSGDGALRRVAHPTCGYALVARYDLPAHYRMVLWGIRGRCPTSDKEDRSISYYPPNVKTGRNTLPFTKIKKTDNYNGVLNPKDTGDLLQFASCPGPKERQNMRSTFQYFGLRNGKLGALEYHTIEAIPKNTQLCQWYGSGWWSAREIKRTDVGTTRYPAPKRKSLVEKQPKA